MFTKADLQAAEQLRRALQMLAAGFTEEQARAVPTVYSQWTPGTWYEEGQYITHGTDANGDPILYRAAQGHTSSEVYPPDGEGVTALYACISLNPGGWPVWSPPSGAQDAYNTGDVVSHNGTLYRSKIDGNTTEPGTDDRWWEIYEEV